MAISNELENTIRQIFAREDEASELIAAVSDVEASGGITSLNTITGDVTLVAGTNITLTPSGSNITIDATGGSLLPNDTFFQARNATDDGNISVFKVNASNQIEIGDGYASVYFFGANYFNDIKLLDSTSVTDITLLAPNGGVASSYVLNLPTGVGTAGQVLSTNGANPAQLSWIPAGSSGADTTLSNLSGTTAINQELSPLSNLATNIGSGSARWNELFVGSISDNSGSTGGASEVLTANGSGKFLWSSQSANILVFTSSTDVSGASSEAVTFTGLLATDTILAVTQVTPGGTNLPLLGFSAQGNDTLTLRWVADPSTGYVIQVAVKR